MGRSGLLASEEILRGWGSVALLGVPVLSRCPQPVNTGVLSMVPMPGPAPALVGCGRMLQGPQGAHQSAQHKRLLGGHKSAARIGVPGGGV